MPSPNATVSTSVCSQSTGPVAMALVLTESFLSAGNRYVELFKEAAS